MNSSTTIFQIIGEHEEIAITFQHRRYNGIDSDPAVVLRAPDVTETAMALELANKAFLSGMALRTRLPYREVHQMAQKDASPGFAGVSEGSVVPNSDTEPNPCVCRNSNLTLREVPAGSHFVECLNCGRMGFRGGNQTVEQAIHRWNTGDLYPH